MVLAADQDQGVLATYRRNRLRPRKKRQHVAPVERILPSDIDAFSKAIRTKLRNKDFAKRYLRLLVDEIVVSGNTATMKGSYAALTSAITAIKKGTSGEVPCFNVDWRARSDSNARPLGS